MDHQVPSVSAELEPIAESGQHKKKGTQINRVGWGTEMGEDPGHRDPDALLGSLVKRSPITGVEGESPAGCWTRWLTGDLLTVSKPGILLRARSTGWDFPVC